MHLFEGNTFADVYQKLLGELVGIDECNAMPRGLPIKEIANVCYVIKDPYSNLFTNNARSVQLKYLCGELIWYFSGDKSAQFILDYSSFWRKILNSDKTANSAYGWHLFNLKNGSSFTQWEWAKQRLVRDKDTRQATMHFDVQAGQYADNKDYTCTSYMHFMIRDNKLNLIVYSRAQDIILGSTYDVPFFMLLMQVMRDELSAHYEDLELGAYSHHIGSLHLYENKVDLARDMVGYPFKEYSMPRIAANPIRHEDILRMYGGEKYYGDDPFLTWLSKNAF